MNFNYYESRFTSGNNSNILNKTEESILLKESLLSEIASVIIPVICSFGIFTNILNIMVFLSPKLKDQSFKYLLAISISDLIYLSICSITFYIFCASFCSFNQTLASKIVNLYLFDYFTSCLAIYSILIEIFLSLQRFFILINKPLSKKFTFKTVLVTLFLISIIYYFPIILLKDIVTSVDRQNSTLSNVSYASFKPSYSLVNSDIGKTSVGEVFPRVLTLIRIICVSLLLPIINTLIVIQFKKRFGKRYQKKSNVLYKLGKFSK